MKKMRGAILAATGAAGQQFVEALQDHPYFDITGLYASEKSAGKKYKITYNWRGNVPLKDEIGEMVVRNTDKIMEDISEFDIIFSALPSEVAKEVEGKCASKLPVISTASAYRFEEDVPILVPEVNIEQIELIETQKKNRNWNGFVLPGPNCTTTGLVVALKPIHDEFGIKHLVMTSLQALSGAGYPGVPSLDICDNIVPFISKEEEKVIKEVRKILGKYENGKVKDAQIKVNATCTRVNVRDGHSESVYVELEKNASPEDIKKAYSAFNEKCAGIFGKLPAYPKNNKTIIVKEEQDRPQPILDRCEGDGMSTIVGRIRQGANPDEILLFLLSHNTKKGAAKGGILVAEYLKDKKLI